MQCPTSSTRTAASILAVVFGLTGIGGDQPAEPPEPRIITETLKVPGPHRHHVHVETETVYVEVPADPYVVNARPTHPCFEDEAAIVRPGGLYCVPVDTLQPDPYHVRATVKAVGRLAYWESEYDIVMRNAHDTDPNPRG